jgi:ubiquinone/menaquinone biosynthesis C-methylase UbiE
MPSLPLFDRILWRDPVSGAPLDAVIDARTPAGVPICGVLQVRGTDRGYPIVDSVVRLTPELARHYGAWLTPHGLQPPLDSSESSFQTEASVDAFGFLWRWIENMRSQADLRMRVLDRYDVTAEDFLNKLVLDAGAGAGDQSQFILEHGGLVVSIDLSSSIDVVASKLRMNENWVGVQGGVTALPFPDSQFEIVYGEGVIQHTRDSVQTIRELLRVLRPGGMILASHYVKLRPGTRMHRLRRLFTNAYYGWLRRRLSSMDRYKVLLATGALAALSYVPLLGTLLRKTGTAMYYDLMPDFRTTWANTFDVYGDFSYQRYITPEEFLAYFEGIENVEIVLAATPGCVKARRTGAHIDR